MTTPGFTLFETAIGRCGIAWSDRGIVGVQLPENRELETRARLLKRFPQAREATPPLQIERAVNAIAALLRGEQIDLSAAELDMEGIAPFHRRVYETARAVSPGTTVSYGEIASRVGSPGASRAVGQALARNPFAIIVPCHRVLSAGGKLGGFSANGGIATKLRLLSIERNRSNGSAGLQGEAVFSFDPVAAVEHLRAADQSMARLIDQVGPFRMELDKTQSIFAALAEAIVYQQLTGKAAAKIFARVRAIFPRAHEGALRPERILRVSDAKLRAAGLSRSKLLSLRDLAQKTVEGRLPTIAEVQRMEDETIIERLTEVRGIGKWTVEMLLIFNLGRPDVLPVDDYGIRKGFAIAFKKRSLPSRQELEKRGARWKPYRTVASWYLWRAVEIAQREGRRR